MAEDGLSMDLGGEVAEGIIKWMNLDRMAGSEKWLQNAWHRDPAKELNCSRTLVTYDCMYSFNYELTSLSWYRFWTPVFSRHRAQRSC